MGSQLGHFLTYISEKKKKHPVSASPVGVFVSSPVPASEPVPSLSPHIAGEAGSPGGGPYDAAVHSICMQCDLFSPSPECPEPVP